MGQVPLYNFHIHCQLKAVASRVGEEAAKDECVKSCCVRGYHLYKVMYIAGEEAAKDQCVKSCCVRGYHLYKVMYIAGEEAAKDECVKSCCVRGYHLYKVMYIAGEEAAKDECVKSCCVRGYHKHKVMKWAAAIGEELVLGESPNDIDRYTVAVIINHFLYGHHLIDLSTNLVC